MEFNADGSLKLTKSASLKVESDLHKMRTTRCIKITKDATRTVTPKLCTLTLETSPLLESGYVEKVFSFFSRRVNSTVKITSLSANEHQITIGNGFSRCRDCQELVGTIRESLYGNVIEKKGSCTFKGGNNYF